MSWWHQAQTTKVLWRREAIRSNLACHDQSRRSSLFRLSPLRLPPSFDYRDTCGPSPCGRLSRPRTTTTAPSPWASPPEGDPVSVRVERDSATEVPCSPP